MLNSNAFNVFLGEYKLSKFLKYIDKLDNYDTCDRIGIINSIELGGNILNKEELFDRINNADYKIYKEGIPREKDYSGLFIHDSDTDKDYIILDTMELSSFTIYHEIGHLVNKHRESEIDVLISDIKKDTINYADFSKLYSDFPSISIGEDTLAFGDIVLAQFLSNEDYYLSDSEIYARLFSYYYFCEMYDIKDIKELGEKLQFVSKGDSETVISYLRDLDFLYILPIINFEKEEKIKLLF